MYDLCAAVKGKRIYLRMQACLEFLERGNAARGSNLACARASEALAFTFAFTPELVLANHHAAMATHPCL